MHYLRPIILWSFLFACLFNCITAQESVFRAGLDDGSEISRYFSVLEDKQNKLVDLSPQQVWANKDFVSLENSDIRPESFINYWLKLTIRNDDPKVIPHTDWVLEYDLGITDMLVYVIMEDDPVQEHKTGYFVPPIERSFLPKVKSNVIKVNIEQGESIDLLMLVHNERASIPPIFKSSVKSAEAFERSLKRAMRNNMFYLGFVLMMLVFNLFMFSFHHDRANIYYSLYLFFVAFHISYNTGDLANWIDYLFGIERPELMYFYKLTAYFGLVFYLAFIRFFLSLDKLLPLWDRWLRYMIYLAVPFLVLDAILIFISNFSPDISDFATMGYALLFVVLTTVFLFPLIRTEDNKRYFIFWGILVMNIGLFLTVYLRLQSHDFSILPFKIGSVLEIIIFSIGIVYRQREYELGRKQIEFELEKSQLLQEQKETESRRLSDLNKFKSSVYANLTHEFRTPLTVILGMADKLHDYPKEQRLIKRNSNDLLRLINRLLDLSKAEANQLVLNPVFDDIVIFVNYLFESITSAAQDKNITLKLISNREYIYMDFDESAIKHIVDNLLSNAIKFTPKLGHIELLLSEIKTPKHQLQIVVKDDGIGIPEEDQDKIFDRFYQSNSGRELSSQGSGLGLALVKEFVERLGGKISLESKENRGSEFTVIIPIENKGNVSVENRDITTAENAVTILNEPIVLVVEDNRDVLDYIASCFDKGYQVLSAVNGHDGIQLAKENIPDIIISDLMMPKVDGVALVNNLKTDSRTSHIPIILLTARTDRNVRISALKKGVDAFMTKPFDKEELLIRVERLIIIRNELRNRYSLNDNPIPKGIDPFLDELHSYVFERLDDPKLSQLDLQQWSNMGKTQLYRKIKSLTNLSAVQYITKVRLEEAKRLLQDEQYSVSEVAYKVGFSDPNYFSRRFSQFYAVTPKEYKDLVKEQG